MIRYRSNAFWNFKDVGEWLTETEQEVENMEVVSVSLTGTSGNYLILVVIRYEEPINA